MDFKFWNKGKEEVIKFDTLEQVVHSSMMSEHVKTQINKLRKVHGMQAKAKAYITVIKNEGRPDEQILCKTQPNQLQDDGRDLMIIALWENQTGATQLGFTHMAVSDDGGGLPTDATTTLAGEISTGGLTRVDADTTTHGTGTATSLIETTYTATATHTNVQKGALFDANSGVTMGIIYLFTSATLVNNDTLKVSVTVTFND